jgi:PAS domain S-box-containing protein
VGDLLQSEFEKLMIERTRELENMNAKLEELNAELEEVNAELEETNAQLEEEILERSLAEEALQKSEERYRGIYENSPLAIVLLDKEFKIVDWNKRAEELFGWTKDEVLGRPIIGFLVPAEIRSELSKFASDLLNTKFERIMYNENITKDGKVLFCEWHNTLMHDRKGNLIGVISLGLDKTEEVKAEEEKIEAQKQLEEMNKYLLINNDRLKQEISERKIVEEALRKSKLEAEQANSAKSQFLANMSHEIRTPMNGIIGMTDLLKYTNLTDEQINMVGLIKSSSNLLLSIINDILDLSKIDAGKVELSPERVDVNNLVHNKSKLLKAISTKKGLEIEVTIENDVPKEILVDKTRLLQVINNLIGNSIKFTEKGKIGLSVKKIKTNGDKVELMFSVTDTGIGIKEVDLPKLFSFFTQLDNSPSKRFQGTGLGLAISKRLVELMGGEIFVESEYGKGSTFYFTILVDIPANEQEIGKTNDNSVIQKTTNNLSILLVEDDPVSQLILKQVSKLKDWKLRVASNGKEALDIYENNEFDLIIMDIQMPEMNGYEVTQRIREIEKLSGKHIPIIATTAYAMSSDKERCLSAGMDDYISKPLDINRLNESIIRLSLSHGYKKPRVSTRVLRPNF